MNSALPALRLRSILLGCLAFAVVAVYCRALCGPLKMCGDAPGYVELAAFLLHGTPARTIAAPGYPHYFPHGYPYLLIGLNAVGLANAPGIIGLNLICLAIGLWATRWLFLREFDLSREAAFAVLLLSAASSVFVQFASSAVSEMPFFAAATASVVCLERSARGGRGWRDWLFGILLCGVAIYIRTAGVALIPAVVWATIRLPAIKRPLASPRRIWLAIPALLLGGLGVWSVAGSHYVSVTTADGFARFKYAPEGYWMTAVARKVSHIGEMFSNQRATDYPLRYRDEFVLLGALCLIVCGLGWWSRRRRFGPVDAYVATYFVMIAAYPFWQLRLWLPIVPFLFAFALLGGRQFVARSSRLRLPGVRLATAYVVAFVLLGCFISWRFTTSAVYPDVDDAINTNRRAEDYLTLLKGPPGEQPERREGRGSRRAA
jgi:hypothetical protein